MDDENLIDEIDRIEEDLFKKVLDGDSVDFYENDIEYGEEGDFWPDSEEDYPYKRTDDSSEKRHHIEQDYDETEIEDDRSRHTEPESEQERALRLIALLSDIHGDASWISAMNNQYFNDGERYWISDNFTHHYSDVEPSMRENADTLELYEKSALEVRNLFRFEKIRYEKYKEEEHSGDWQRIEQIWDEAIVDNAENLSRRSRYPIRKQIEKIFSSFSESFIENGVELAGFPDLREALEDEGSGKWFRFIRVMEDSLSYFRVNMPGSKGHLLWLLLYISEINYFQAIRSDDDYALQDRRIKESQPQGYWDGLVLNDYVLNNETRVLLAASQAQVSNINNSIQMLYMAPPRDLDVFRDEYKRVKGIIYRDKDLRREFIYTKNVGTNSRNTGNNATNSKCGTRCFAVLTNRKDYYIAVSGGTALFNLCKKVFASKAHNAGRYVFIEPKDYSLSLYAWDEYGTGILQEISQRKVEQNCIRKRIRKPSDYARMFSCAERRLLDKYNAVGGYSKGYVILSKKAPCYMCRRVLVQKRNIDIIYYEPYVGDERKYMKTFDSFASRVL